MYSITLPKALVAKYKTNAPRYTSYPTVPSWQNIEGQEQKEWYADLQNSQKALAFYFHIPFCYRRCLFCGCNTIATKNKDAIANYVQALIQEINLVLPTIINKNKQNNIQHIHFGGGTPSFLEDSEFELIFSTLQKYINLNDIKEISIEVDPTSLRENQLESLSNLGFNRISMGLQDVDEQVQKAIGRNQSAAITQKQIHKAKQLGFSGLNLDLIYGLPLQTLSSFDKTLDFIIEEQPDRLAIYNFAYLPEALPHQKKLNPDDMPSTDEKTAILQLAIQKLTSNGYRYIGMDHFAKVTDDLAIAQEKKQLHRNFMGYSPFSNFNLVGFGASSISEFESYFLQNIKSHKEYTQAIQTKGHALQKGMSLSQDDQIRKWVISQLICNFQLIFADCNQFFSINFQNYFQEELNRLLPLEKDGLLSITPHSIQVKDIGILLIRNICLQFDSYAVKQQVTFSTTL